MKSLRLHSPGKLYSEIRTFRLRREPLSKSSQRVVVGAFYRRDQIYSGIYIIFIPTASIVPPPSLILLIPD